MFKNKPVTLIVASALMILLVALGCVMQFAGSPSRGSMNGQPGGAPQGDFQPGQMPDGATLPDGAELPSGGNFQPPADGERPQGGNYGGSESAMKLMQLLRGVQIGAIILISLLGILSVVGMFLNKNWGRTLAIVASILMLVACIPAIFQRMFGLTLIGTLGKAILAIAIIVLCFISKPRQAQTPA